MPVPVKLKVCGLSLALSMNVTAPVCVPVVVGVKVKLILQLAPAATVFPQVLVCAKSPEVVTDVILSDEFPVLVSVTVCGVLVVPTV